MHKGRQAFVICPLIEESDKLGAKSATAEYERLSTTIFPDLRVELLHGRMPAREKTERMQRFVRGDADVLVATSVVEVGVDVPNATIMVIEGAERFGLAQLHQFRGRVGRDQHQSYCLLFEGGIDEEGSQRLAAVAATDSGFELAGARPPAAWTWSARRTAPARPSRHARGGPAGRGAGPARPAGGASAGWMRIPASDEWQPLSEAMNGYRAVFDID